MTAGPRALWSAAPPDPLSVTELVSLLRDSIRDTLPMVWVEGEISGLKKTGPGHLYFTLKDEGSALACVWWRTVPKPRFELADGLRIILQGSPDVYVARGQLQLVARQAVPKGIGSLELAFRQLKEKLEREGLFDPARKRPLPRFCQRLAIVTSPRAAGLRDFLEVVARRWPRADLVLIAASVQGESAPRELLAALARANQLEFDAIALIRGGGSIEDLWAFNDEALARAIAASRHPVVTGIGHEVDVTIADLVADRRALTPTEAAQILFEDRTTWIETLRDRSARLAAALQHCLARQRETLENQLAVGIARRGLSLLERPRVRIEAALEKMVERTIRLLRERERLLDSRAATLDALSPLRVLDRGYALVHRAEEPIQLVRDATTVNPGDRLTIRLARGQMTARVEETKP